MIRKVLHAQSTHRALGHGNVWDGFFEDFEMIPASALLQILTATGSNILLRKPGASSENALGANTALYNTTTMDCNTTTSGDAAPGDYG